MIESYSAFLVGMCGAFVVYMVYYRETHIKKFLEKPMANWHVLTFDLLAYMICGGLVTLFLISPESNKEAFLSGATWQGIFGGVIKGVEVKREGEYKKWNP